MNLLKFDLSLLDLTYFFANYSLTELPGYKLITNNKIEAGRYYAQSFSLKEQSQSVVDGFKQVDPNVTVESYDFWTDVPFYNYLNGESL